jgi:hypothetical protein
LSQVRVRAIYGPQVEMRRGTKKYDTQTRRVSGWVLSPQRRHLEFSAQYKKAANEAKYKCPDDSC